MTALPGFTPTYDANGNLLTDSAHTYTWDANGRPVSIDTVNVTYDAFDRMAEQNRSGSYTEVVYAPSGFKLALMSGQTLQKAFVPLPSGAKAVYTATGLSYYRHPDWLGSSRLASTPSRTIYADVAYAPFGESYSSSGTGDLSFTGQNQDTVSGLYDFPQREYSPTQGRWISPDPLGIGGAKITNPRTWNRYAYALNDPLSMVDPNGECSEPGGPNGLSAGQVGVCVDVFIAAPTIGDYGIFNGVGDGRGPVSDDPSATFRVEYSIVYDSNNDMVSVSVTTDPSVVSFMGALFSASLTGDTTGNVTGTANSDGSWTVSIDTSSLNGWAGAPAAPDQPILLDLSLTISPDGTVESDGGQRSAFPSLEVWSYQPGQDPYNVLYIPESGNPNDLGSLNQDVPSTGDPSTTVAPGDNNSGDNGTQDGSGQDGSGDGGGGGGGGGDGGGCGGGDGGDQADDECSAAISTKGNVLMANIASPERSFSVVAFGDEMALFRTGQRTRDCSSNSHIDPVRVEDN
jgi:RHS repeat-associated protein